MRSQLPPGPRTPRALQMLGWWSRPTSFMERCRERYGDRFTIRLLGQPPWVLLSDPNEIKQLMTAPAEVLHPGEGARILEPVVGHNSQDLYASVMLAVAYAAVGRQRQADELAKAVRQRFPTFSRDRFGSALRDPSLRAKLDHALESAGL